MLFSDSFFLTSLLDFFRDGCYKIGELGPKTVSTIIFSTHLGWVSLNRGQNWSVYFLNEAHAVRDMSLTAGGVYRTLAWQLGAHKWSLHLYSVHLDSAIIKHTISRSQSDFLWPRSEEF